MSRRDDWEPKLVEMLAHVYAAVNWRKVSGSKFAWDVWNHRVRAAATRATVGEFLSRLANYFGLQSLPPEAVELAQALRPDEGEVLNAVYAEHVPIAMRAVMLAREWRGQGSTKQRQASLLESEEVRS